ncbi:MAG: DUF2339 domain-containing protein, partial [Planktotalea sp.]|uniref:DUF2339 domain-containing protein n=1 Tax=Planktotalea sp. TaxID=2029877 RepID=UPI003C78A026
MDFEGLLVLFGVLIGLAVLLAPIGVVILFKKLRVLNERLARLEFQQLAQRDGIDAQRASPSPLGETAGASKTAEDERIAAVAPRVETATANAPKSVPDSKADVDPVSDTSDTSQVPRSFVFRTQTLENAASWLKENWFLGIAAVSLALAGIFMVQYGVEQGLLTPFARIMGALGLGAAFIALGEIARRRFGDEGGSMNALPSTFSGAGIVTLFAAVLSARHLYAMLPSDLALIALVGVAALAVVLGWFYGPFLAAVGVVGALGAPFTVGGSSDAPHLFFYYFALIVVMALAIDTVRRWAWV